MADDKYRPTFSNTEITMLKMVTRFLQIINLFY